MNTRASVGIAGVVTACILLLSPVPTFVNVYKNKSNGELAPYPYICTLANAIFWVLYSIPMIQANITVLVSNAIGVLAETAYGWLQKAVAGVLVFEYVGGGVLGWVVYTYAHTQLWIHIFLGCAAAITAGLMYLSAFFDVYHVHTIKKLPSKTMIFLPIGSLLNSLCWMIYSVIGGFDLYIFLPNVVGILCSCVQFGVCMKYFNGPGIPDNAS